MIFLVPERFATHPYFPSFRSYSIAGLAASLLREGYIAGNIHISDKWVNVGRMDYDRSIKHRISIHRIVDSTHSEALLIFPKQQKQISKWHRQLPNPNLW